EREWRRWTVSWRETIPAFDTLEVRVQRLGRRHRAKRLRVQAEGVMKTAAGAAGIDEEIGRDAQELTVAGRLDLHHRVLVADVLLPDGVQVDRAYFFGFADERFIEGWPIPVGVSDLIVRARCDQQLPLVKRIFSERFAASMKEKGESPFQADGD